MIQTALIAMMAVLGWQLWRLDRKVGKIEQTVRSQAAGGLHGGIVGRSVIRTVEGLEADSIYLWDLRHRGKGSRRRMVRRGDISHHRWNMASGLLTHLNISTDKVTFDQGVHLIRAYIAEQTKLAACATYVPPWCG